MERFWWTSQIHDLNVTKHAFYSQKTSVKYRKMCYRRQLWVYGDLQHSSHWKLRKHHTLYWWFHLSNAQTANNPVLIIRCVTMDQNIMILQCKTVTMWTCNNTLCSTFIPSSVPAPNCSQTIKQIWIIVMKSWTQVVRVWKGKPNPQSKEQGKRGIKVEKNTGRHRITEFKHSVWRDSPQQI